MSIFKNLQYTSYSALLCLVFLTFFSTFALADRKDSIQAIAQEFGDPTSFYLLGRKYLRGDGINRNINNAIRWFEKAAEKGHLKSHYELGKIYFVGKGGIKPDFKQSAKWFLEPATQGYDDAQYKLGIFYLNGKGVSQDPTLAHFWLTKAADQNNTYALYTLGKMYYLGDFIDQDINKAKAVLNIARELGATNAEKLLNEILEKQNVAKRQIELANSPANRYLKQANNGSVDAQFALAQSYLHGTHELKKSTSEAIKWLKKSAKQNHAEAQYLLGKMYYKGQGIRKNTNKAKNWLAKSVKLKNNKAKSLLTSIRAKEKVSQKIARNNKSPVFRYRIKAEQNNRIAQYKLGTFYLNGTQGLTKDEGEARKWFLRAANNGHKNSQFELAKLAIHHDQSNNAIRWLTKAAIQGHAEASFELGRRYYTGIDINVDHPVALKWLLNAAQAEHDKAAHLVIQMYVSGDIDIEDISSQSLWLKSYAISGDINAQYLLASMYANTYLEMFNEESAVKWFRKAAKQGLKFFPNKLV